MTEPTCGYAVEMELCGRPATHRTADLPVYPEPLMLCAEHAATYPDRQAVPLDAAATDTTDAAPVMPPPSVTSQP